MALQNSLSMDTLVLFLRQGLGILVLLLQQELRIPNSRIYILMRPLLARFEVGLLPRPGQNSVETMMRIMPM